MKHYYTTVENESSRDSLSLEAKEIIEWSPEGNSSKSSKSSESSESRSLVEVELLFDEGRYSAIPEREFLFLAWQASRGRDWNNDGTSETWQFCRHLCAHPKFKSLTASALVLKLRRFGLEEEHLESILAEIPRVRFAKGAGPLDWAVAMAASYPVQDPEDLGLKRYDRFLTIAGWLQVLCGEDPIYLPVEKLGQILGVSPRSVSTWRTMAKQQGLLTETSGYIRGRKATRFRFAIERFGIFREREKL
jgi:hypothetical protein